MYTYSETNLQQLWCLLCRCQTRDENFKRSKKTNQRLKLRDIQVILLALNTHFFNKYKKCTWFLLFSR